MITMTTPAEAGIPEATVLKFMNTLRRHEINLHSVLMMQGGKLFYERYWKPFDADTPHRMYSVTKSFVSVAVGCLVDEGRLCLDDPVIRYFPDKLTEVVPELLKEQTVRDMLTMRTCFLGSNWFKPEVRDRTAFYFSQTPVKPAGTLFDYDSTGSYILGVLVERLSGMPLMDYLRKKVLDKIGGFENAQMLKTPDGTSWGDSALLCTPRAMLNFARFVMNMGTWEGERLLSEEYLREAVMPWAQTDLEAVRTYNTHGYGYQIWRCEGNAFSFHGMGAQYAICVPDKDFIFVCTGDNQYNRELAAPIIFHAVFEELLGDDERIDDSWPDELPVAHGAAHSPFEDAINGAEFICVDNPMGIRRFRLCFSGGKGTFEYTNAQGEKQLHFNMKENRIGLFPQLGYSDEYGNVHENNGFMYRCAASAGWLDEKTLQLRVQIIDRYFGSLVATFGFRDAHTACLRMVKVAEDFLDEYSGWAGAFRAE